MDALINVTQNSLFREIITLATVIVGFFALYDILRPKNYLVFSVNTRLHKVLFWNGGDNCIIKSDIYDEQPLVITCATDSEFSPESRLEPDTIYPQVAAIDSCSATITFESLEHNEGFCIKYNGSGDIAISGKIRNRKLWNHKKNPHRYLMRILAILLLVSLLVMGWICADYYDSYILGNSYMTGSEESSAQSNERVLRSSAEELYYTSRWGIGIDIDIEEVKKSADEKARYELDVLQKRINYRIESGLLPGDSLADNNDNLRFSDNISAALIEVTIVVGLIIVLILFNPFRDPFSIQAWKKKLWKVINDDT